MNYILVTRTNLSLWRVGASINALARRDRASAHQPLCLARIRQRARRDYYLLRRLGLFGLFRWGHNLANVALDRNG